MHHAIHLLLEIQEVDQRITELQNQLNRYPQLWEEMKSELKKRTDQLEKAKSLEVNLAKERRSIAENTKLKNERLKKYNEQKMQVTNTRELNAVDSQIDSIRKELNFSEERDADLKLQEEENVKTLLVAEDTLEKLKQKAVVERDRIRKLVGQKTKELELLKKDREKFIAKADPDSLKTYEAVRKRWPENPLVAVRTGSCTGCYFALLPNRLIEVHLGSLLLTCDNCGRILSEDEHHTTIADADSEF